MSTTQADLTLSSRVRALKPSVTVAFTNRAKQMRASGVDVLGFAAGEPDFGTPQAIKDAAKRGLDEGLTRYQPTLGPMPVRETIATKLRDENNIGAAPGGPQLTGEHVAIGCGGKHVLYSAMHALLGSADADGQPDEVLLPTPAWVSYRPIAELAGAEVSEIPAGPETDFKITPEQLRAAITPRSRLLVINSPSNPCGTMYSESELRALAAVVAEAAATTAPRLLILTDEIYEKIVYGGIDHFSLASIPEIAERTLTLNGMSKAYAMTGWRIGYAAMPGDFGKAVIKALGTLQGQMTTNITAFNYPAITEALTNPQVAQEVEQMRQAFAKRAKLIEQRLSAIDGINCPKPTGAFYVFPDVSALFGKSTPNGAKLTSATTFSEALLEEAHVAFVPGEDFGGPGANHVRISFACSEDQINAGMDRFGKWVQSLG
ncbi:MAG: pyridoxal phosphate-dependent aminotransferase [Planctomycetota bacterium]